MMPDLRVSHGAAALRATGWPLSGPALRGLAAPAAQGLPASGFLMEERSGIHHPLPMLRKA